MSSRGGGGRGWQTTVNTDHERLPMHSHLVLASASAFLVPGLPLTTFDVDVYNIMTEYTLLVNSLLFPHRPQPSPPTHHP